MKHSKFSEQIEEAISNPTPLGVKLKQARALGLIVSFPSFTSCLTISTRCSRPALPCPAQPSPYMHCCLLNVYLQRPLEGGQPCHTLLSPCPALPSPALTCTAACSMSIFSDRWRVGNLVTAAMAASMRRV